MELGQNVCLLSVEIERQIEQIQAQRKKLEPVVAPGDKVGLHHPPTRMCASVQDQCCCVIGNLD